MAFNMKPGRLSFQKTGHGLPSALLQERKNPISGFSTKEEAENAAKEELRLNKEKSLKEKPLGGVEDVRKFDVSKDYTIAAKEKVNKLVKPGTKEYKKWQEAVKKNPSIEDKFKSSKGTVNVSDQLIGKDKPKEKPKTKPVDEGEWYAEHSEGSINYTGSGSYGLSFDPEERRIKDLNYKVDQNASKDPSNPNRIAHGKNNYQHRPLTDQEKRIMNDDRYASHEINPYIAKWKGEGGEARRQSLMNAITGKMDERDAKQKDILTKRSNTQAQKAAEKAAKDKITLEARANLKKEVDAKREQARQAIEAKRKGNTNLVASATPQLRSQNKKSPAKQMKSKAKTPAKMKKY
jgi:hypothetical protein